MGLLILGLVEEGIDDVGTNHIFLGEEDAPFGFAFFVFVAGYFEAAFELFVDLIDEGSVHKTTGQKLLFGFSGRI